MSKRETNKIHNTVVCSNKLRAYISEQIDTNNNIPLSN